MTGPVKNIDPNYINTSNTKSSKDKHSSRKAEPNSDELTQPTKTDNISVQENSSKYVPPKYYSLLQVIAGRYNGSHFNML